MPRIPAVDENWRSLPPTPAGLTSRKNLTASRETFAAPQKFVSNIARTTSSSAPSASPSVPYPALFATTSMRPNLALAAAKALMISCGLVTSSLTVSRRSEGYLAVRSDRTSGRRRVAIALSPLSRTSSVRMRPNPVDAPVTVKRVRTDVSPEMQSTY